VDFWYLRISRRATVPGLNRCGFFTPPVAAACNEEQGDVDKLLRAYSTKTNRNALSSLLCGELLARGLASRGLTCSLLKLPKKENRQKHVL